MKPRHSFDPLRRELLRRGLSLTYIERVIAELDDHRQDLLAEELGGEVQVKSVEEIAMNQLGSQRDLAVAITTSYRRRTFAGRHPFWTFVVAPLPLTLLLWITFYVVTLGSISALRHLFGERWAAEGTSPSMLYGMMVLFVVSKFLPAVAAALVNARWIARSGRPIYWYIPACLVIALVTACHQSKLTFPSAPGTGQFMIGFGTNVEGIQFAIPLLVGALLFWRLWHRPDPGAPAATHELRAAA
jgi:hypothetical protein